MSPRRSSPPPLQQTVFRSAIDVDCAIAKFQRRIEEVEALERDQVDRKAAQVRIAEHNIRDSICEVFGRDSVQYERYQDFYIDQSVSQRVGVFGAMPTSDRERQMQFVDGLPNAVARIRGLIDSLNEKRRDLEEPTNALRAAFEGRSLNTTIAEAASDLYRDGHYAQAVLEASKALVNLVKNKSERPDLDGANLMRTVFSRKNAILSFNGSRDQSDEDEQEGMMHLFEGAVMAIRNPAAHRVASERHDRALQHLELLSLLADRLDESRKV